MKRNNGFVLKLTVFLLALCSMAASLLLVKKDDNKSWLFFAVTCVISLALLIEIFVVSRNVRRYILKMDKDIALTQKESLYYFPAPTIIIDENSVIVWYNKLFEERVFTDKEAYGQKLTTLLNVDINRIYTKNGAVLKHDGRYYRVIGTRSQNPELNLSMVYFEDISQFKALEYEHFNSRPCVVLLMIDNYEDMLSNVKESEKAHILVQIETLLEKFMEPTTGILRRNSNDKFVAVIEERHIQEMIDKRFDILDKARQIMVNERLSVTLSMGVGRGGETLSESELFAKQALDMSLGRGGDQCSVKTATGFEFFGGVSKGIEKHTKVKTRIIATALAELIEGNDKIFIMGHRFGDLDSAGSSVGLCGAIRKLGKESYVVIDPHKNLAKQLINHIKTNDIKDMFLSPEDALNYIGEKTLLIIVDTHNPDFVDSKELYEKCRHVVVIDHHRKMVNFIDKAVIFYHEPYASSASEMVTELIQYFGENLKISAPEAEALLAGIMLDTKNFVMRTGVRTFEAAAFLRKLGADTVAVRNLFSSSIETYQQKSRLVANAELYHNCAIATSDIKAEEIRMAAPQAADELLGISGVSASFVLFELNGVVNVSARSLGNFNVQVIMEKLGGGGHQTMAGVQLEGVSLESARQSLCEAIDEFIQEHNKTNK